MQQLDALGEMPEHLVGIYDIVHLRLFQVVVKDNDPGLLLRNMLKMLSELSDLLAYIHIRAFIYASSIFLIPHIFSSCPSFEVSLVNSDITHLRITFTDADIQYTEPGGHLQWAEYDMTSHTTIKAGPSLSSSALDAIPAFVQGFKKIEKHGRVGTQKYFFHFLYHFLYHIILQLSPFPNLQLPRRRILQILPDMLSPYNNSHQLIIPTKQLDPSPPRNLPHPPSKPYNHLPTPDLSTFSPTSTRHLPPHIRRARFENTRPATCRRQRLRRRREKWEQQRRRRIRRQVTRAYRSCKSRR